MIWVIAILFSIGILVFSLILASMERKTKDSYREAYQLYLVALKEDPTNSDLRQRTLLCGRNYLNIMRDSKGNTVFDEVSLMNDINAACAGAHQLINNQITASNGATESIESRLEKLRSLRDKGLIDDDDFSRRKKEMMDQI